MHIWWEEIYINYIIISMYLHYHSATNSGVTVYLSDFCVAVMEIEFLDLGVDSLWGTK